MSYDDLFSDNPFIVDDFDDNITNYYGSYDQSYIDNLDPEKIMYDPHVLADIRSYFEKEGKTFANDDEMRQEFYDDRTWGNLNTVGIAGDLLESTDSDSDHLARMQRIYDRTPFFWQDGGAADYAGGGSTAASIGKALVLDPLNIIPGVSAAKAAARAGATGKSALKAGALAGAKSEAVIGAGSEAVHDLGSQARDTNLGLQDEISLGQTAVSAAAGATIGGAFGGLLGGIVSIHGKKLGEQAATHLAERGVTKAMLESMSDADLDKAISLANAGEADEVAADILSDQDNAEEAVDEPALDGEPEAEAEPEEVTTTSVARNIEEEVDFATEVYGQESSEYNEALGRKMAIDSLLAEEKKLEEFAEPLSGANEKPELSDAVAAQETLRTQIRVLTQRIDNGESVTPADITNKLVTPINELRTRLGLETEVKAEQPAQPATTEGSTEAPAAEPEAEDPYAPYAETYGDTALAVLKEDYSPEQLEAAKQPVRLLKKAAAKLGLPIKKSGLKAEQIRKAIELPEAERDEWLKVRAEMDKVAEESAEFAEQIAPENFQDTMRLMLGSYADIDDSSADLIAAISAQKQILTDSKGKKIKLSPEEIHDRILAGLKKKSEGKPQPIVAPGKKLGGDPDLTVTRDTPTPRKGTMGEDDARSQAARSGKADPIPYNSTGQVKVGDATSSADRYTKRGETVWFDPITDKTYRDFGNMQTARGEHPATVNAAGTEEEFNTLIKEQREKEKAAIDNSPEGKKFKRAMEKHRKNKGDAPEAAPESDSPWGDLPEPSTITDDDVAGRHVMAAVVKGTDQGLIQDWLKAIKEARKSPAAAKPEKKSTAPRKSKGTAKNPGTNRVPAIRITKGKRAGKVLVPSAKQLKAGGDIPAALAGRLSPDAYEIGTAPEGARSMGKDAADNFLADNNTDNPREVTGLDKIAAEKEILDNARAKEKEPAIPYSEAADMVVAESVNDLTAEQKSALVKIHGSRLDGKPVTVNHISVALSHFEVSDWRLLKGLHKGTAKHIATLYELLAEVVPQGIKLPNTTRKAAIDSIDTIFSGHSVQEIEIAKDFLKRLNTPDDVAPKIEESWRDHYSGGKNSIGLASTNGSDVLLPKTLTLFHEVGHWSYNNILTPADRLEFWRIMEKGFSDESPHHRDRQVTDEKSLAEKIPTLYTNEAESPQEYFAWQFQNYVTKVMSGNHPSLKEESFWKRIVKYFSEVFNYYNDPATLDPDLKPLFAKILPEETLVEGVNAEQFRVFNIHNAPETTSKLGPHIKRRWIELDEIVERNTEKMNENNPSPEALMDLAVYFKSIAVGSGSAKRSAKNAGNTSWTSGSFSPVRTTAVNQQILAASRQISYMAKSMLQGGDALDNVDLEANGQQYDDYTDAYESFYEEHGESLPDGFGIDTAGDSRLDDIVEFWSIGFNGQPSLLDTINLIKREYASFYFGHEGVALSDTIVMPPWNSKNGGAQRAKNVDWKALWGRVQAQDGAAVMGEIKVLQSNRQSKAYSDKPQGKTNGRTRNLKKANQKDLVELIKDQKGTKTSAQAAQDMLRRMKSEPIKPSGDVTIPKEIQEARIDALGNKLADALTKSDSGTIDQITAEMHRRWEKRQSKGKAMPGVTPKDSRIGTAIRQELADWDEAPRDAGIPPNASAPVRELLSYITHRNPEVEYAARTMAHRLVNLLNSNLKGELNETQVMSVADAYRLVGKEPPVNAKATFLDTRSPVFNELRTTLRKWAVGLNKGEASPMDLMHEIGHMAVRTNLFSDSDRAVMLKGYRSANDPIKTKLQSLYKDKTEAEIAEEWFAESWANYAAERVSRDDVWGKRISGEDFDLTTRSTLSMMLDRLIEGVAYIVNGLIGRNTVKQQFRRMTFYGDMISPRRGSSLRAALGSPVSLDPHIAATYAADSLAEMEPLRRQRMKGFVGNGMGANEFGQPVVVYHGTPVGHRFNRSEEPSINPSTESSWYGPGVYMTENPLVARDVYGEKLTPTSLRGLVDDAKLPEAELNKAHALADDISKSRRDIFLLRRSMETADSQAEREVLNDQIDASNEFISARMKQLKDMGVKPQPRTLPLVTSIQKGLDLTAESSFDVNSPFLHGFVGNFQKEFLIPEESIARWAQGISDEGSLKGPEFYKHLLKLPALAGHSAGESRLLINRIMKDMGYDGLKVEFDNTLNDGTKVNAKALIAFDPNQVKHIEADYFDAESEKIYDSRVGNSPTPALVSAIVASDGPMDARNMSSVAEQMERAGASKSLTSTLINFARGNKPTDADAKEVRKFSGWLQLGSNSKRMRANGLGWIADKISPEEGTGYFEKINNEMGKKILPIFNELKSLPDVGNFMRRYLRDSNPFGGKQPASFDRITKALRRPIGSAYEKKLSAQEMEVYRKLRKQFADEAIAMKAEGVMVGDIRGGYFPQVWDADAIAKNREDFEQKIANYLMDEHASNDSEMSMDDALKIANSISRKIINEDGVYVPTKGTKGSTEDNIDFARQIRLDQYPQHIRGLEGFMSNNLQDVLVKYFDGSTRKRTMNAEFGWNNHGFHDYMAVVEGGKQAAATLLHTNAVHTSSRVVTRNGEPHNLDFPMTMMRPLAKDKAHGTHAINEALRLLDNEGEISARNYLLSLDENHLPASKLRVEAIIQALKTTGGEKGTIATSELKHAAGTFRALQHKPISADDPFYDASNKASKALRNFNSLTLLSFTTLTSLPDVVLPLLRSGRLGSTLNAWYKYASNPDYRSGMQSVGTAIENLTHQRLTHLHGADSSKVTNAFFNATGLTGWTNFNRNLASAVGIEAFKAEQQIITKHAKAGIPLHAEGQPAKVKLAARRLNRYGLKAYAEPNAISLGAPEALEQDAVREALIKFANDTIFTPNSNDIPLWGQTPWGSVIMQLKSFPVMMGRMMHDAIWKELKQGNPRPAIYMASIAPMFGAGALATKDIVQIRGGEDNKSAEVRERSIKEWASNFGYEPDIHGDADAYLGWYIESLIHIGGLGLISDLLYQTASQVDNGAYGQNRVASLLLGPSYGTAADAFNIAGGAMDAMTNGDENGNGKERTAVRTALRRIPVFGGLGRPREAAVDTFAGEADDGKGSGGWGF